MQKPQLLCTNLIIFTIFVEKYRLTEISEVIMEIPYKKEN